LANVVLFKLLESSGLCFSRYTEDFTIWKKSCSSGYRVMQWAQKFLSAKLKLVINEVESKSGKTNELHFLCFIFKGKKLRCSELALSDIKHEIRSLAKRP
jgi:hypothetical protein